MKNYHYSLSMVCGVKWLLSINLILRIIVPNILLNLFYLRVQRW